MHTMGVVPRVGPNGEFYAISWDTESKIYFARSFNGLEDWATSVEWEDTIEVVERNDFWCLPEPPGPGCESRFPGDFRVPPFAYLAVDSSAGSPRLGTLYCVYFDTTLPNDFQSYDRNVDLYFTKSTDRGETWTTPTIMNTDPEWPGDQFFPWIEVDCVGNLHVVFFDTRNSLLGDPWYQPDDNDSQVELDAYYAFSSDGGDTWQEFRLTEDSFNSEYDGHPNRDFWGDYLGLAAGFDKVFPAYPGALVNAQPDIYTNIIDLQPGPCCTSQGSCESVRPCACVDDGGTFLGYDSECETAADCNENDADDQCDIPTGTSEDCDGNGIPDECPGQTGCCDNEDCGSGKVCCGNTCYTGTCCSDTDCGSPTPACRTATHTCVQCVNDTYCDEPLPFCRTGTYTCVECFDHSDCEEPEPYCGEANLCVECVDDNDCTGPKCYCGVFGSCLCCQSPPCPMGPSGGG
jgi:hypothetical protein